MISGVGIGGPTLAFWLQAAGFEPTLIEYVNPPKTMNDLTESRKKCCANDLGPTSGKACVFSTNWIVPQAGAERFSAAFAPKSRWGLFLRNPLVGDAAFCASLMAGQGSALAMTAAYVLAGELAKAAGRHETAFREYEGLLLEKLGRTTEVIFGNEIADLQEDADGVQVQFKGGSERRFDLVIGADGLHSAVRRLVFGPQDLFEKHLGYVVAAFEVRCKKMQTAYRFNSKAGVSVGLIWL